MIIYDNIENGGKNMTKLNLNDCAEKLADLMLYFPCWQDRMDWLDSFDGFIEIDDGKFIADMNKVIEECKRMLKDETEKEGIIWMMNDVIECDINERTVQDAKVIINALS